MKKDLRLWFTYFWGKFDYYDNLFTYALSQKYNVIVTPNNPHLVISNDYRERYQNAKMVYFSSEPFFDIGVLDYATTQLYVDEPKFVRLPLYLLYAYEYYKLGITKSYGQIFFETPKIYNKVNFCAYLAGGSCPTSIRERFFNKLSEYKQVHAAGNHLRNIAGPKGEVGTIEGSIEKIKFISSYKFVMSFENKEEFKNCVGWTSEKIIEPRLAGSIPIHWGNPRIDEDFNDQSIINWYKYGSDDKTIEKIIEIDNDDDLYMDYIKQPFINLKNKNLFEIDYVLNIFDRIITNEIFK